MISSPEKTCSSGTMYGAPSAPMVASRPQYARVISSASNVDGTRQVVRYEISAPDQLWDRSDNGTYTVRLHGGEVFDQSGNASASQELGTFTVKIPQRAAATPNRRQAQPRRAAYLRQLIEL